MSKKQLIANLRRAITRARTARATLTSPEVTLAIRKARAAGIEFTTAYQPIPFTNCFTVELCADNQSLTRFYTTSPVPWKEYLSSRPLWILAGAPMPKKLT